ncbi:MAG: hypothetical protein KGZ39_03460 [Simkania sp.]|nr:hypothetical protein [Simkania sp.]
MKFLTRLFYQIIWILFFIPRLILADNSHKKNTHSPVVGNFSLSASQQPGPLVSFGENIIDKGQTQLFVFADAFMGKNNYFTDVIPSILYGIRNDLSLFLNVPFSPGNKDGSTHSSGLEDVFAQLEYAFYNKDHSHAVDQATLVANVTFPTGSSTKTPPTGFGSSSFFIGATFNHMLIDWFFFLSPGATLTTSKHQTHFGDQLLYQCGLGKNIPSPSGWIFAWMIEFDGLYAWKNTIKGALDPNSGGNTIYVTPSIWISSKRVIIQFGAGYPIVQHLFGHQSKQFLSLDFNVGITF